LIKNALAVILRVDCVTHWTRTNGRTIGTKEANVRTRIACTRVVMDRGLEHRVDGSHSEGFGESV
jgi:hypothetical protein